MTETLLHLRIFSLKVSSLNVGACILWHQVSSVLALFTLVLTCFKGDD